MQGVIIDFNLILGDDKNRYNFSKNDIKNGLNLEINDRVDFVIDDKFAREIYLLSSNQSPNLAKIFGAIGSLITICDIFFGVGKIFVFIGFFCIFFAFLNVQKVARVSGLASKYAISLFFILCGICTTYIAIFTGISGLFAAGVGNLQLGGFAILGSLSLFLIMITFYIIAFVYYYKAYSRLAKLSSKNLFLYQILFYALGFIFAWLPFLGALFSVIGALINLIAWISLQNFNTINE